MSDNRKILIARRKSERKFLKSDNKYDPVDDNDTRKGCKKALPRSDTYKKNLANDRLKRLRTSLSEQILSSQNYFKPSCSLKKSKLGPNRTRKRQKSLEIDHNTVTKMVKNDVEQSASAAAHTITGLQEDIMDWSSTDEGMIKNTDLYIICDTNIFISHMQLVRNITEMPITGPLKPIIFIPWMVIEELDFLKEDQRKSNTKFKAQAAIKFIEESLSNRNERIMGQTLNEVNEQNQSGKNPDNKIIACCLQLLEKHKNIVLLTNDINLKNKAHINHIPVSSENEIMLRISRKFNHQSKSDNILHKMVTLCSFVIRKCAINAYGEVAKRMPIYQTKLNTIKECLQIFKKYWFPVFQEMLLKQCRKTVEDLEAFVTENESVIDSSKEFDELIRQCTRLCIYLKDIDNCKSMVEETIRYINSEC